MSGNVALVTNKGSWNALTNAPAISNSTSNNSAGDTIRLPLLVQARSPQEARDNTLPLEIS